MASVQLDQVASTVLDASGNGSVSLTPASSRTVWDVTTVSVQGSSVTNVPTAAVFLGSTNLGGTYAGTNDSDNVAIRVWPGQLLTVTWAGGDPGASASAYVYGTVTTTGAAP